MRAHPTSARVYPDKPGANFFAKRRASRDLRMRFELTLYLEVTPKRLGVMHKSLEWTCAPHKGKSVRLAQRGNYGLL